MTVVGYYFLSQTLATSVLRQTLTLSLLALFAVAAFLLTCYCLLGRLSIGWTLLSGIAAWLIIAAAIIILTDYWL